MFTPSAHAPGWPMRGRDTFEKLTALAALVRTKYGAAYDDNIIEISFLKSKFKECESLRSAPQTPTPFLAAGVFDLGRIHDPEQRGSIPGLRVATRSVRALSGARDIARPGLAAASIIQCRNAVLRSLSEADS